MPRAYTHGVLNSRGFLSVFAVGIRTRSRAAKGRSLIASPSFLSGCQLYTILHPFLSNSLKIFFLNAFIFPPKLNRSARITFFSPKYEVFCAFSLPNSASSCLAHLGVNMSLLSTQNNFLP